jgi:4-amino-4-deoxy-L-arabinose transferase-like glycosyltransferase
MEWYYAKNGQQLGPVSQESLLGMYQRGEIKGSDLVWNETMSEWMPLTAAPGLPGMPPPMTSPAPADTPPPYSGPAGGYTPPASAAAATSVLSSPMSSGQPMPPNYLWQSIVCLVICCWPFAIPAIIFATKVRPAYESGDYAGALEASKKAKTWFLVSLIVGFIVNILVTIFYIAVGMAEVAASIPQQ